MATGGARGVRSGQDRGAAGKVSEEAVIRVLDILIVVLLEKTTHEPELRSAAVTDGQERAGSNGPKPNQQMGDNLPSSRKRSRPATPAAPTSTASIGSAARHRVRGRAASTPRNARSAKARTKGRFPDNIPCSTASRPSSSTCWSPRCCPCAVPLVQAISGIKLSEASAMLSRCVMGGGHRGAPPATPDVDDFGSTASGSMSWDPDVQVPAPQARARDRPVLQGRPGPRTWASVATSGSHLLRELTFVVEATARLMKSLLREVCHKVNKSASKTLNDAGRKRYRTIRAPGNCPTSRRRRKENVDASPTRTTCTNVS